MTVRLEGKVGIVTGASSGIGRSTALHFAREGAKVVVADVSVDGGEETVRLITDIGGDATFVKTDVANEDDVRTMVQTAIDRYGRLDIAFNNAGIEGEQGLTAGVTRENWDRVIGINLTGVWLCMKEEIPHMLEAGGGAIVNCSSVAGLVGFAGIAAYTASKHGVNGLTKTAALEYGPQGIRVNSVCPGVIMTPMVERFTHGDPAAMAGMVAMEPIGRLGRPEEIADTVVWLCSDESSFVTGQAIAVDGGFVAR